MMGRLMLGGAIRLTVLVLATAASSAAMASQSVGMNLPDGWVAMDKGAAGNTQDLKGAFRGGKHPEHAVIVRNKDNGRLGLAISTSGSNMPAEIVATFDESRVNPPKLSLIRPGTYPSVCHDKQPCSQVKVTHVSVGMCFGEASCEIVYFDQGKFHEMYVTD